MTSPNTAPKKLTIARSPIIGPSPLRNGDPPDRNAELTVYEIGPDPEAALAILREMTEARPGALAAFERTDRGAAPLTVTLPRVVYDPSDGMLVRLKRAGCVYTVTTYAWVCPEEEASDRHWCSGTCRVMQIAERIG